MTAGLWPVHELLPHGDPMILIDEVVETGDDWASAAIRIGEDSLFYRHGKGVPVWAGIEYMAQTSALFAGIKARREDEPVRVGLLLGTRDFQGHVAYFRLGVRLIVQARQIWSDGTMGVFDCRIDAEGLCLAEAKLNCYQPTDFDAFLAGART